jgi:hypothetical protein
MFSIGCKPIRDNQLNLSNNMFKVIKVSCYRLMSHLPFEASESRSLTAWSRWVSLLERSCSCFVLQLFVCMFSFSSFR